MRNDSSILTEMPPDLEALVSLSSQKVITLVKAQRTTSAHVEKPRAMIWVESLTRAMLGMGLLTDTEASVVLSRGWWMKLQSCI